MAGYAASAKEQPRRPKVLIVDDDPEFLRHLSGILKDARYDVIETLDADQAIATIERLRTEINVAIVDLALPGEYSGFDLIGALTRHPNPIRIIATSGVFREDQLYTSKHIGAHEAVPKTACDSEWLQIIESVLED